MKYLLVLLFLLSPLKSSQAERNKKLAIEPCMYLYGKPATMTLDAPYGFQTIWTEVEDESAIPFIELEAIDYIEFLGYAPKGYGQLEWYGVKYGWMGIDLTKTYPGLLLFYDANGKVVARAEVRQYSEKDVYLVWITALELGTDSKGEHLGYHTPLNAPKGGCNFIVEEHDFQEAMGWE